MMERRRALFELIKNTKLNKLTIKQGDENVKLNLKTDLIDSNVNISDQVLDMLEAYTKKLTSNDTNNTVSQNQQETQSTSVKELKKDDNQNKNQLSPNLNNLNNESNSTEKSKENECVKSKNESSINSPSKRVRFLDTLTIPENNNNNNNNGSVGKSKNIFSQTAEINDEKEKATVSEPKTDTNNQQESEFSCRLCKLKCTNERSLHDHVARVHGGKAPNLSKSGSEDNAIDNYDEINSEFDMDEEDLDEENDNDNETFLSSNSDLYNSKNVKNKKEKKNDSTITNNKPPKPNVAIRVAKVAYYNSKDTLNSKNPFKSNIFTNGGIRGNFFSQERLPLRSCKIKIKINNNHQHNPKEKTNSELDQDDLNDLMMSHTARITSFAPQDRNTTITVQSIESDNNLEKILTNDEIKKFFKSLINYIPISNITRLEDLIKSNETYLNGLDIDAIKFLRYIYECITGGKQFGISLYDLKQNLSKKFVINKKMSLLIKLLDLLIRNYLILPVGVVERVFIAHEFKQHWVIQSCKNLKGRSVRTNENDEDDEINNNEDETTSNNEEDSIVNKKQEQSNKDNLSKQFQTVCLIPRPWRYIDGLLNRPVLKKMLENIVLHLKSYPYSTFESISSHFCPVLQPIQTLELLEMLEKLKCVKKMQMKREEECDLFSDFNNGSHMIENEDDLEGNEINTYYCTQTSIFILRKIFP